MKRRLAVLTIVSYLTALSWGVVGHALSVGTASHPAMYFVVWDMFCGWAAWSQRMHIVGEGESGRYYELAPGPWGPFRPFGKLDRRNYDPNGIYAGRLALNCLRHTRHEPIVRIFVVEESWPKKFNLPEHLWAMRYEEPKDVQTYYRVRHVLTGEGALVETYSPWLEYQAGLALADNPRLRADARRSTPFYAISVARPVDPNSAGRRYSPGSVDLLGSPAARISGN
ncbi:MAG: hypothetical protein KY476_20270 [Planctomycetes bacterium]|nr:hypothetical protein [Planctomycetota bacterium]